MQRTIKDIAEVTYLQQLHATILYKEVTLSRNITRQNPTFLGLFVVILIYEINCNLK